MATPSSATRFVALDIHRKYVVVGAVDHEQQIVLTPRRFGFEAFSDWATTHSGGYPDPHRAFHALARRGGSSARGAGRGEDTGGEAAGLTDFCFCRTVYVLTPDPPQGRDPGAGRPLPAH